MVLDKHRKGEGVDNRRKHTHLVSIYAVEALTGALKAPENISAAIYDGNLHAGPYGCGHFFGTSLKTVSIKSFSYFSSQTFAAEFKQNPFINRFHKLHPKAIYFIYIIYSTIRAHQSQ